MKTLKPFFLVVDFGFIVYWLVTALHVIPPEWAFNEYDSPVVSAWNWSFLPLDLLISASGMTSLYLWRRRDPRWRAMAIISLVLTLCSGLQAIAFWSFRAEFDAVWWAFNGFLLVYPLFFLPRLVAGFSPSTQPLTDG